MPPRTRSRKVLILLARLTGLVVVVFCGLLLGCQSRLIYFPRRYQPAETKYWSQGGGVTLAYTTPHGRQNAYFRAGSRPGGRIWLFCPGNAMLALDAETEARRWDPEAGWLFLEYPGYGGNEGRPSPSTIAQNIDGATRALAGHLGVTIHELKPRLGASGQSLGAAVALMAVDQLGLDRAVIMSPFTTLTEMGRRTVGWPWCHLNLHRYDNRRTLQAATARGVRVWIVHGIDDEIIPIEMARELAALSPASVRLVEVPGAGHNDLWGVAPETLSRVFHEAGER